MSLKAVVYRPARNVGFGHALFAMSHYNAMARALSVPFFTTFQGQIYSLHGGEGGFLEAFFTLNTSPDHQMQIGYQAVKTAVQSARQAQDRVILIGRDVFPNRAPREFPYLRQAEVLEYKQDWQKVTPEYLQGFDLIYIDSVLPNPEWVKWFAPITSPLRFQAAFLARVRKTLAGGQDVLPYVGLHARHGNGEYLDGRISGDTDLYEGFLAKLAQAAREKQAAFGAAEIICLSDNVQTAQKLAALSGGRVAGADNLPDQAFQKFIRNDPSQAMERVGKIMFDFAVLSGADHIVGGESYFPRAAQILVGQDDVTILKQYVTKD